VNGEEVLGYAVTGYRKDSSEGYIEDLPAQRDRLDVAGCLLSHACRHLDEMGVKTQYYQLVEGHPYQELSKRKGFINSRSRPHLLITPTPEGKWNQFP